MMLSFAHECVTCLVDHRHVHLVFFSCALLSFSLNLRPRPEVLSWVRGARIVGRDQTRHVTEMGGLPMDFARRSRVHVNFGLGLRSAP